MQRGSYIVEVRRTRSGQMKGKDTRPYRFGEFDLLAVCIWASTGEWHSFLYLPAKRLVPDPRDESVIKKMQPIPHCTATTILGRRASLRPLSGRLRGALRHNISSRAWPHEVHALINARNRCVNNRIHLHTGKLSCFFAGISTFLPLSIASARTSRLRVARGMITSSI